MEIVIKIPKEDYERMKEQSMFGRVDVWKNAIKNGTPLPEHHGRLIDADALINSLGASDRDIYCKAVIEEDAPTIIEGSDNEC